MTSFSLTTGQMEALCQELRQQILHFRVVRWAAASPYRLFLILEQDLVYKTLLLCFERPFLRFHTVHFTRIPKQNEPLLTEKLEGYQVKAIELLNQDRILHILFQSQQNILSFIGEFFPKHPNYYVVNQDHAILFSLYPSHQRHYHPPSPPPFIPSPLPLFSQPELEKNYAQLEVELDFQQEKKKVLSFLQQQIKQLQKKGAKLRQELQYCLAWEQLQVEGELLKANFASLKRGLASIQVWDWTQDQQKIIPLDPQFTPQEEVARRFRRSKKLQAGIPHLQAQLQKLNHQLDLSQKLIEELMLISSHPALESFKQIVLPPTRLHLPTKKISEAPPKPYHEYTSAAGIKIWVGKHARANDTLTFQLARGSDWWLHAHEFPGSHVIVRVEKGQEPDSDTLEDALQLALYYSKAKQQGEAEICVTQRKFVSRLGKKQPGKVQISKHKTFYVKINSERYQRLKDRQEKK